MKLQPSALLATAVLAAGAISSPPIQASEDANATAYCQSALPVFDTNIRKRPLAVRNEGAASAFVSCSIPSNYLGPNRVVTAYFVNRNANAEAIHCTFVDGVVAELGEELGRGDPVYYPGTVSAQPGVSSAISWFAEHHGLPAFSREANLSCNLPTGTEIAFVAGSDLVNID